MPGTPAGSWRRSSEPCDHILQQYRSALSAPDRKARETSAREVCAGPPPDEEVQIERPDFKTKGPAASRRGPAVSSRGTTIAPAIRRPTNTFIDLRGAQMAAEELMTTIKTSEIPAGGIVAIDVRGTQVAVANVDGTYHAFDDACTHEL